MAAGNHESRAQSFHEISTFILRFTRHSATSRLHDLTYSMRSENYLCEVFITIVRCVTVWLFLSIRISLIISNRNLNKSLLDMVTMNIAIYCYLEKKD